jgi:uncharacterized membrane protein
MSWLTFFGRFHPLLVHLPIGILIIACLFDWLSVKNKFQSLKDAVHLSLLLGAITALASCITGYLLSLSGEYDANTVGLHQWLGIITMVVSFAYWQMKREGASIAISRIFSLVTLILLSVTGHLGGTLTHGENYLIESLTEENVQIDFSSLDLNKAFYYQDIVMPILSARCYSCHGETKQKGKLRLDQADFILKGGKSEKTVVASHADESELINRLLLPVDEKKHMPPKEKPQLSSMEVELLSKWISLGADFKKSVKELKGESALQKILSSKKSEANDLDEPVASADEKILTKLRKFNVVIFPIAEGNNHLSASFVNAQPMDSAIALLPSLKDQLVWLTASSSKISDAHVQTIGAITAIRKLDLSHSKISDKGIGRLKSLNNLVSLNLSHTAANFISVKELSAISSLKEVYLFNTSVSAAEAQQLRKDFPTIHFEFGNYTVPTFASDTTLVKPPDRN